MTETSVERRRTLRWIVGLKIAVSASSMEPVDALLSEAPATAARLRALREQKVILRADADRSGPLGARLRRYAAETLGVEVADAFGRELDVMIRLGRERAVVAAALHRRLKGLPGGSIADLGAAATEIFQRFAKQVGPRPVQNGSVAHSEAALQTFSGDLNDAAFAVFRVLNETARLKMAAGGRLRRADRDRLRSGLLRATPLAANLNTLDWVIDSIAYGDLIIAEVNADLSKVQFAFADPRLQLLRLLNLRSELVSRLYAVRTPRFVRDQLAAAEGPILGQAVDFYATLIRATDGDIDLKPILPVLQALLNSIEADDDLLFAASSASLEIASVYTASLALRWYALAAEVVRADAPPIARAHIECPPIPFDLIVSSIKGAAEGARVRSALAAMTAALPSRSHFDLVRRPFVLEDETTARPLLCDFGIWNAVAREHLLADGSLGHAMGKIWETFYAESFVGTGWRVLGRGVKLKSKGRLITDVDLLLVRGDLLLVVQIKALIGSGVTTYDHWRNRQTIEWGCQQARAAAGAIEASPGILRGVGPKPAIDAIRRVQPVVLTNLNGFDGWVHDGVPVLGETLRKSITTGSAVHYTKVGTEEILHTHRFHEADRLSTDEIVQALSDPISLRLAPETSETTFQRVEVGTMTFDIPTFVLRSDVSPAEAGLVDHAG